MALALKHYQQQALDALKDFYIRARVSSSKAAFEGMVNHPEAFAHERVSFVDFFPDSREDVPCVCLRVPTGGGKTLIAAHGIAVTAKYYADSNAPVVLWLVPSDPIRQQTLKALADVSHPYRQAVMQTYGDRIKVCDLDSLQTINPHDVGKSCLIIVTTIQAFNVSKTSTRNVYAFYEELSPHFAGLTPQQELGMERVDEATLEAQPHLTRADIGRVKHSLANWFHLHRPIIVLDEAHKNRTKLSFTTFARLNPECLVELTATPRGNNVLYSVSAAELKAAQMIKLPIVLTEHPDGWQACLRDALLHRQQLEVDALKDPQYIRPIALIQAQPKGGEATVDVVRAHLINALNISENEIAVATGSIKELTDVELASPSCPIRVVITVEALREGWDCPFAYVLASLQNMSSAVDVEQILGRVLRMPYAQTRPVESLNKSYAHLLKEGTIHVASNLKDRMVNNMGFNRWEAAMALANNVQGQLEVSQEQSVTPALPIIPEMVVSLNHVPDTSFFSDEVKAVIKILPTNNGKSATVVIQKGVSEDTFKQVEQSIIRSSPPKAVDHAQEAFNEARAERQAASAPENWNAQFALIPQLCLLWDDEWQVVEKEVIENAMELDLLKYPLQLAFAIREVADSYEIDMDVNGTQVTYHHLATEQLHFNDMQSELTEHDLVTWLDKQVRQQGITQTHMRAYLLKLVSYLIHERKLSLTALLRSQFQLAQAVRAQINIILVKTRTEAFQTDLFGQMSIAPEPAAWNQFEFKAGRYPVRDAYRGSYEFKKHFYAQIDDLREKRKDRQDAEEFICARFIDTHQNVKHWVRNIPQQRETSFHLPTATDYFYPDFICELNNGVVVVIEYKGEGFATNDDSREKNDVGIQWANSSKGKCRFIMVQPQNKDPQHRTIELQINDILA
jgi:type III restriction enzyme